MNLEMKECNKISNKAPFEMIFTSTEFALPWKKLRIIGRHSFFVSGAILVQMGYQSVEIMDTMYKTTPRY
jgi:hypothetical protein